MRNYDLDRLRSDLFEARQTIIAMMPVELSRVLSSYHECGTLKERHRWLDDAAEKIIALAELLPIAFSTYYPEKRANCPLCGCQSSSTYSGGFSVPEGLRRHLVGYGKVAACRVMRAARGMADDYFWERFDREQDEKQKEETAQKERRKKAETIYKTGPSCRGQLRDDVDYGRKPRSDDEMGWAENRLASLGFEVKTAGRLRAYTRKHGDHIVYADPRTQGVITFCVWRCHAHRTRNGIPTFEWPRSFQLQDTWKHHLLEKFDAKLVATVK
jgi:hypothetical protein